MAHISYLHYIYIYITYSSSDYRKTRSLNALIRRSIYSEDFLRFIPCRTKVPCFRLIAGDVAQRRSSDLIANDLDRYNNLDGRCGHQTETSFRQWMRDRERSSR